MEKTIEEGELEKIVYKIKAEPNTLICISILKKLLTDPFKDTDIDFYEEWIALWPTAKELSNKGVERVYDNNKFRGKLKSFVKDFYKHTGIKGCKDKKTLIMAATKAYISKVKSGAIEWEYIMSPGNFISHQYKGSSLAMYINSGAEEKVSKVDYRNLIG